LFLEEDRLKRGKRQEASSFGASRLTVFSTSRKKKIKRAGENGSTGKPKRKERGDFPALMMSQGMERGEAKGLLRPPRRKTFPSSDQEEKEKGNSGLDRRRGLVDRREGGGDLAHPIRFLDESGMRNAGGIKH